MIDKIENNRWLLSRNYYDERERRRRARKMARERLEEKNEPEGWWIGLYFLIPIISSIFWYGLAVVAVIGLIYLEEALRYKFLGISGGFVLLAALTYVVRLVSQTLRSHESAQAKSNQARGAGQVLLSASRQLTSSDPIAKTGAILALEEIAIENPNRSEQVVRLLASFLATETLLEVDLREGYADRSLDDIPITYVSLAAQTALDAISRINTVNQPSKSIDLTMLDLAGAELSFAKLPDVLLVHSKLDKADLSGAILDWSNLSYVSLRHSSLDNASAIHARFEYANLSKSSMRDADLNGSNFHSANLTEANLVGANLEETSFLSAQLEGAAFNAANLKKAKLQRAKLAGAYFINADLSGANFEGADLTGANFRSANISGTSFSKAILRGAEFTEHDLHGALGLTEEQIKESKVERNTAQG